MAQTHPLEMLVRDTVAKLGNHGMILVLLETPSGFAIFSFCGATLYLPDAMETIWAKFVHDYKAKQIIWLREFQTFEDKSSAINVETGVNKQLTEMIMNCRRPGQTLAVEKPEYATIIQKSLKIPCLCDDAVMELIWGLKNLMHSLVPQEKIELTKEDRLPMSRGLIMFLRRYGLVVKPDVVNKQIVLGARALYSCECVEEGESAFLQHVGRHLLDISRINYQDWDLLKLSTALKLVCFPHDDVAGDPHEIFSNVDLSKLKKDAKKYKPYLSKVACLRSYKEIVGARQTKTKKIKELKSLIEEAEQAYEAEQARGLRQCVKLNKRKRLKLKMTKEDNETCEAEQAQKVKAHEVEQTEAQQLRRLRKRVKLSKEKLNMRLIKPNKRLIMLYRGKHTQLNN